MAVPGEASRASKGKPGVKARAPEFTKHKEVIFVIHLTIPKGYRITIKVSPDGLVEITLEPWVLARVTRGACHCQRQVSRLQYEPIFPLCQYSPHAHRAMGRH